MAPKKLLIGGAAAVGSVATIAVVASQNNKPDASKEVEPTNKNQGQQKTKDQIKQEQERATILKKIEDNLGKITKWLEENKTEGSDWSIEIEENGKTEKFTKSNPEGLSDYLEKNSELLKSLTSGQKTNFTFRKNEEGNWENIFTKEQIDTWVKNTLKDKSTLKLFDGSTTEELKSVDDMSSFFFNSLENREELFTNLKNAPKKTRLFEKYGNIWKHSITEIKSVLENPWVGNNNFEVKIKKGNEEAKDLDKVDEDDLVGLMDYLYCFDNQQQLAKFKNPKEKINWIFEKKNGKWKTIYTQETIKNWIEDASNEKAQLKIYENGSEKDLSEIKDEDELGQLFGALSGEGNPFKSSSENYVVVFEKYGSNENNKSWMHVKEALGRLIMSNGYWWNVNNLAWIEIQTNDNPKENKKLTEAKDKELIGLLEYLKSKKGTCKQNKFLTIKKGDNAEWKEIECKRD